MSTAPLQSIDRQGVARPRILIVDDSAVARAVLARMIDGDGRFSVAAALSGVDHALAFLARETVDVILLDLEMPGIDGLTALPDMLTAGGTARILIVSSSCADGAGVTVQALALGAADTLVKPGGSAIAGRFGEILFERLERLTEREDRSPLPATVVPEGRTNQFDIVAIGASTGGIHALSGLLRAIPPAFRCPILITQHLPATFSPYFAAQMAVVANRPCDVAQDRVRVREGRMMVAPGDAHLMLSSIGDGGCATRLSTRPVENGNMPSVDPMFSSLAAIYGSRLLAVVLSGMGRDGLSGAAEVRAAGGTVIAQDAASSVVWGMPGAVAEAGLANAIMAPERIGMTIATQGARR